jgi:hypothetical protein
MILELARGHDRDRRNSRVLVHEENGPLLMTVSLQLRVETP